VLQLAAGWPAVIGLAAVADSVPDADVAPQLFDFLAQELYAKLTPLAQDVAKVASLSPTLDRDVVAELVGEEATSNLVEEARRSGLFTERGRELQIHPLVRAFLSERAQAEGHSHSPAILVDLFRRRRDWDSAFAVASQIKRADWVADILECALRDLLRQGRLATISRWVELIRTRDRVFAIAALAQAELELRRGAFAAAESSARDAATLLSDESKLLPRALIIAGRAAHLSSAQRRALSYFTRASEVAQTNDDQWDAVWGRFISVAEEDVARSRPLIGDLESRAGDNAERRLRLATARLVSATYGGGLLEELSRAEASLPILEQVEDAYARSSFLNTYAHGLASAGRYDDSLRIVERELHEARNYDLDFVVGHALTGKALIHLGLRQFAETERVLSEVDRSHAEDLHLAVWSQIVRTYLALARRDFHSARKLTATVDAPMPSPNLRREFMAARALTIACTLSANSDEIDLVLADVPLAADALSGLTYRLARAVVEIRRHHEISVHDLLRDISESGHINQLVVAYRAFPELLQQMATSSEGRTFLHDVLQRAQDHALAKKAGIPLRDSVDHGELLSPREREVHALLAEGLSNREIAAKLFITEVTVKVHVRHIFEKLNVRTRMQAARLTSRGRPHTEDDAYAERGSGRSPSEAS
jgi:ATP/maltotriose-dependent transcriptional regulator MalT